MGVRLVSLLVLGGCSGALPGPGLVAIDVDGDGWTVSDGDCDEEDPDVSPGALDWPGDEVDQDCDGEDATALPVGALEPGDLVVTEVMADPVGVDGAFGEWFEIRNTRDTAVDLEGLIGRDAGSDDFFVGTSLVVEAGGVLVFGASDDPSRSGGVEVDHVYEGDFGLSNAEDQIRLEVDGRTIDAVSWDRHFPHAAGFAMSLDADADAETNDGPEAWCLAETVYGIGGRGTPGARNPACPEPFDGLRVPELPIGGLVLTEIMKDPSVVDGDYGEWFEVYNATGEAVDLEGLGVEDDSGEDFDVFLPLVVPAGGYVVLGSFVDPLVNGEAPIAFEWRWSFSLANSGDTIRLLAGTRELDAVAYDAGIAFPDFEGASLSLDPDAVSAVENDDGASWCEGIDPYGAGDLGSPGEANPDCR